MSMCCCVVAVIHDDGDDEDLWRHEVEAALRAWEQSGGLSSAQLSAMRMASGNSSAGSDSDDSVDLD
jgi:hypothetical protein